MGKILVLNFFPAFYPPSSGGELRYYNFYNQLSSYFDITLLSPTYENSDFEVVEFNKNFREYRVPKEKIHTDIHIQIASYGLAPEISALVCAISSEYPNRFHHTYLDLYKEADIIIHESPYMLNYDMFFGVDKKPRIYNSYNVEYDMLSQYWEGNKKEEYLSYIKHLEKKLVTKADLCFAVSREDMEKFVSIYNVHPQKLKVVPNGIEISDFEKIDRTLAQDNIKPLILFFGSYHPPNIEAAEYIVKHLAPSMEDFQFIIAGSCCAGISSKPPKNVSILGKVSQEEKIRLFSIATAAINPMFSGGGTNIKMIEYMAAGIPSITTPTGARGLNIVNGIHAVVSEIDGFKQAITEVTSNKEMMRRLSENGSAFARENYSWQKIASRAKEYIQEVLEKQQDTKKTILVLNDFPVEKPMHGGEVRINRIYSALSKHKNICLLCFSRDDRVKIDEIRDGFVQIQVPKTPEHRDRAYQYSWYVSAEDIINSIEAPKNKLLKHIYKTAYQHIADAVVFVHPYMVTLFEDTQGKPVIYESLNIETSLKKELLKSHPRYTELIKAVEDTETKAINISNLIIAVSEEDADGLTGMGADPDRIHVVRNGTDVEQIENFDHIKSLLKGHPFVVFVGSGHIPNVEAAEFIVHNLALQLKDCVFGIVGGVCDALTGKDTENILLFGKVSEEYKNILLSIADIGINPVTSGSGSNLKLADYMSKGVAVVTTGFGARGYEVENYRHCIIAERDEFADIIKMLLKNRELKEYISRNALDYAKNNLSWDFLGQLYNGILDNFVFSAVKEEHTGPRLFFDVSNISIQDLHTGIQRVIKSELLNIKKLFPDVCVRPVRISKKGVNLVFKEANIYSYRAGIRDSLIDDRVLHDFKDGDIYYNPDWNPDLVFEAYSKGLYYRLKNRGVRLYFMVYDILPVQMPQHFPPWQKEKHERWLETVAKVADGLVCISNAVREDLMSYLEEKNILRENLRIEAVTLGADIPTGFNLADEKKYSSLVSWIKSKPTFLMVGTVEPRKGHYQVVSGFEMLWEEGYDINLLIIGKEGWKGADENIRKDIIKALNRIKNSTEYGNRLIWLEDAGDDVLDIAYRNSAALIIASEGEGFGLPAVEASFYGLPVIARDIPVFREVCQGSAFFFANSQEPSEIKEAVKKWLTLYRENKHPKPEGIRVKTWQDHTRELLKFLGLI